MLRITHWFDIVDTNNNNNNNNNNSDDDDDNNNNNNKNNDTMSLNLRSPTSTTYRKSINNALLRDAVLQHMNTLWTNRIQQRSAAGGRHCIWASLTPCIPYNS